MTKLSRLLVLLPLLGLVQCSHLQPVGTSISEKRAYIDRKAREVLYQLQLRHPASKAHIANAEGLVVFRYSIKEDPVMFAGFGAGSGFGVATDRLDQRRVYLRAGQFEWSPGMYHAAQAVVITFASRQRFEEYLRGAEYWQGECTVGNPNTGTSLGPTAADRSVEGVRVFVLSNAGVQEGTRITRDNVTLLKELN